MLASVGQFPHCSLERSNVLAVKNFWCAAHLTRSNLDSPACYFHSVILATSLLPQKPPPPLSLSPPKLLLQLLLSGRLSLSKGLQKNIFLWHTLTGHHTFLLLSSLCFHFPIWSAQLWPSLAVSKLEILTWGDWQHSSKEIVRQTHLKQIKLCTNSGSEKIHYF